MKTIGIMGGMGPLATAEQFKNIICFTDAKSDDEHIPKRIYESGAQTIVLGCTELPIVFRAFGLESETLDTSGVLAKRAIERAGAKIKL